MRTHEAHIIANYFNNGYMRTLCKLMLKVRGSAVDSKAPKCPECSVLAVPEWVVGDV